MSEETLDSSSSNDVAMESGGEVGEAVQLIEQKSESVRGQYNSLHSGAIEQGAEMIVAFLEACRRVEVGSEGDLGGLRDCLVRMVLTQATFADFRGADLEDDGLEEKVNSALKQVGEEVKRSNRDAEFLLNHVVPPSQWPHSTKPVESEDTAASQVREFVSHALLSRDGSIEDIGEPEHFIARQGWKVPVTLRAEDGQEYQGTVTIYEDGEIAQKTRGMLKKTFGMETEENE